jgi:hypothetical protein
MVSLSNHERVGVSAALLAWVIGLGGGLLMFSLFREVEFPLPLGEG